MEGSLEVKLPAIWTNGKKQWEESEKRRVRRERVSRKKIQVREGRKVAKHCVFSHVLWLGRFET